MNGGNSSYGKNWDPTEHYKKNSVAATYDGERFNSLSGKVFNHLEKRLVRKAFAALPRNSYVLDAPCGTGRLSEVLLEMGLRVVGVDISPAMLEVAAARLKRFGDSFVCKVCDVRNLDQLKLSVDGALCARVLMHFPLAQQIVFLREIAKTTSHVVFTQGIDTSFHRFRRRLKKILGNQPPAVYPVTPQDIGTLLAKADLVEVGRYSLLPLISESLVVVTRSRNKDRAH